MARASTRRSPGPLHTQMLDRGVYDPAEFEAWLSAREWSWRNLERGDYGVTLGEAMWLFTMEDPVRWCETFMVEPDSGDPYRYFDYQKPSLRSYGQDVIHQDGAEIGKTREIVGLLLWTGCTGMGGRLINPSCLVGAPMQVFLDEIIGAIEQQMGTSKGYRGKSMLAPFWLEPKRTPHTKLRFNCPNPKHPDRSSVAMIDFRPAGHDGEAFRGVHVNALALVDEAAKMKSKTHWTEFYRAMMPGCRLRAYSVPDGDRTTEFFRLCQQAVADLPVGSRGYRLFHWAKTIMPAPFWSPEREAQLTKLFGGKDTPGYKRNVLGEWGDAENPVIRWDVLLPNVVDLPEFRLVKLAADGAAGLLYANVQRIELVVTEGRKSGREHELADSAAELEPFLRGDDDTRRRYLSDLIAPFLSHFDPRGVYYAGGDLGERNDPTEIVISEQVGEELRDVLRVQARGFPYHLQEELIFLLDRAFGHRPYWGIDLGSAGTAVVKDLLSLDRYATAQFDGRLFGFHFQENFDCMGEDGEALTEETDTGEARNLHAPAKHWATVCIVARLQQSGYRLAFDNEVLNNYTSQTAREGAKWPIYSKTNDHDLDARRQQMLAKLRATEPSDPDVFSVGVYDRRAA